MCMNHKYKLTIKSAYPKALAGLMIGFSTILVACDGDQKQQPRASSQQQKAQSQTIKLEKEFEQWLAQQDKQKIQAYQQYLAKHLKHPPSLFELSYNKHVKKQECLQERFSMVPQDKWKNIVAALKLIEKLQQQGLIENYKITSIYRSPSANQCIKAASKSKHLNNYAVDFQVLDKNGNLYASDDLHISKQLCQFWKTKGAALKMGLGTYVQHQFHIDVQGYRTWGSSYSRDSSACLE